MAGMLYGVGVGPGDPELLTLKAVRVLQECDAIGLPARSRESCRVYQIALQAVPQLAKKPAVCIPVPMTVELQRLEEAYDAGAKRLAALLEEGKRVAFLNLGDPSVYGTYMELHLRLERSGYPAKMISGVPSFCAVAAALGIPLGARREAIHILPGFYRAEEVGDYSGTRILMKSAGRLDEVKRKLLELEEAGRVKAVAVENCGMDQERIHRDLRTLREDAGYFTTIIVKEAGAGEPWKDM